MLCPLFSTLDMHHFVRLSAYYCTDITYYLLKNIDYEGIGFHVYTKWVISFQRVV